MDVVLDRLDMAGPTATVWVWLLVSLVLVTARLVVDRRPPLPDRRVLIAASAVAAAMVSPSTLVVSPVEWDQRVAEAGVIVGVLLIVVSVACALSAAVVDPPRAWADPGRRVAGVVAMVLIVAAGGGLVVARSVFGEVGVTSPVVYVPSVCLLLATAMLASGLAPSTRDRVSVFGTVMGTAVGYPALLFAVLIGTTFRLPIAPTFTALAGNPPVRNADTDTIVTVAGIVVGVVFGFWRTRAARTAPAAIPVTPPTQV